MLSRGENATPEQKEIARLYEELVAGERDRRKLVQSLQASEEKFRALEERVGKISRKHSLELGELRVRTAEIVAQSTVAGKRAAEEALATLNGYLMALSEIGNGKD
jgi:DNA repair exonuclease SbcCD ATPase subunit